MALLVMVSCALGGGFGFLGGMIGARTLYIKGGGKPGGDESRPASPVDSEHPAAAGEKNAARKARSLPPRSPRGASPNSSRGATPRRKGRGLSAAALRGGSAAEAVGMSPKKRTKQMTSPPLDEENRAMKREAMKAFGLAPGRAANPSSLRSTSRSKSPKGRKSMSPVHPRGATGLRSDSPPNRQPAPTAAARKATPGRRDSRGGWMPQQPLSTPVPSPRLGPAHRLTESEQDAQIRRLSPSVKSHNSVRSPSATSTPRRGTTPHRTPYTPPSLRSPLSAAPPPRIPPPSRPRASPVRSAPDSARSSVHSPLREGNVRVGGRLGSKRSATAGRQAPQLGRGTTQTRGRPQGRAGSVHSRKSSLQSQSSARYSSTSRGSTTKIRQAAYGSGLAPGTSRQPRRATGVRS